MSNLRVLRYGEDNLDKVLNWANGVLDVRQLSTASGVLTERVVDVRSFQVVEGNEWKYVGVLLVETENIESEDNNG